VKVKLKVAAGTVTYGDRSGFLYKNVDRLLAEGFDYIYVLFNGVSNQLIIETKERYAGQQVLFIESEKNVGSAGGYYKLLRYVHEFDRCDRLLLLDDDNLVPDGFLKQSLDICKKSEDIFYFHRPDRMLPLETFLAGEPWRILGGDCNFLGRTVFATDSFNGKNFGGDLLAAPYGGLFLPRAAIEKEIFPDQDFYLYADDYDFTFRLCLEGNFNIVFVRHPEIIDLERSFHLNNEGSGLLKNRYSTASDQQLFFFSEESNLSFFKRGIIGYQVLYKYGPLYSNFLNSIPYHFAVQKSLCFS
jgi:GT2 family glycosyltransferase